MELVDLLLEQLARRKRDQRQLVDRRAVLLLGRAQDGEVHEIDRGVGLQQVAPGALARVRLARDQQHAQLVAHAVDRHDRAIVDGGEFAAFHRRGLDLDDVLSGMRDLHLHAHRRRPRSRCGFPAVSPSRRMVSCTGPGRVPWSSTRSTTVCCLSDDAEARRGDQLDAAVALARPPGDQRMHRRREAELRGFGRHVMHAAVGDEDRAGDAIRRHVGERRAERREQAACRRSRRRPGRPRPRALRGPAMRPSRCVTAARAASVCFSRSPKFWLGLLSVFARAALISILGRHRSAAISASFTTFPNAFCRLPPF